MSAIFFCLKFKIFFTFSFMHIFFYARGSLGTWYAEIFSGSLITNMQSDIVNIQKKKIENSTWWSGNTNKHAK